jgi:small subunit ribosomal protein S2
MTRQPAAIFIVDILKEHIALAEARRLNIPTFALVDTNSNPKLVDFPIPANDDASKSITIIIDEICKSIQEGLEERKNLKANPEAADAKAPKTEEKASAKAEVIEETEEKATAKSEVKAEKIEAPAKEETSEKAAPKAKATKKEAPAKEAKEEKVATKKPAAKKAAAKKPAAKKTPAAKVVKEEK